MISSVTVGSSEAIKKLQYGKLELISKQSLNAKVLDRKRIKIVLVGPFPQFAIKVMQCIYVLPDLGKFSYGVKVR